MYETKGDLVVVVGWVKRWSIDASEFNRGENLKETLQRCIVIHHAFAAATTTSAGSTSNQHRKAFSVGRWSSHKAFSFQQKCVVSSNSLSALWPWQWQCQCQCMLPIPNTKTHFLSQCRNTKLRLRLDLV